MKDRECRRRFYFRLSAVVFILLICLAGCNRAPSLAIASTPEIPSTPVPTLKSEKPDQPAPMHVADLLPDRVEWRYTHSDGPFDKNEPLEWTQAGYDDSAWRKGAGPFGAKNGVVAEIGDGYSAYTLLPQYGEDGRCLPCYYFRAAFQLASVGSFDYLQFNVLFDDALILYINGVEVYAGNVPKHGFDKDGYGAYDAFDGPLSKIVRVPVSILKQGRNVIAAEVHQHSDTSSDVYFALSAAELACRSIENVFLGVGADRSSALLSWYYEGGLQQPHVVLREAGSNDSLEAPIVHAQRSADGFTYYADFAGVENGKSYRYDIACENRAFTGILRTGGGQDGAFEFFAISDTHIGYAGPDEDGRRFAELLSAVPDGAFIAVLGDIANGRQDGEYRAFFHALNGCGLRAAPVMGNHDDGSDLFSGYVYLPNMSRYGATEGSGENSGDYWFDYDGTLLLAINSNQADASAHDAFIREAQKAYRARYGPPTWTIVLMHHSLFSCARHKNDDDIQALRESLVPIFAEAGVDLVLAGHDHSYARAYVAADGSSGPEPGAPVLAGDGTMYVSLGPFGPDRYFDVEAAGNDAVMICRELNTPSITGITVTKRQIDVRTYMPLTEELVDSFSIIKQ